MKTRQYILIVLCVATILFAQVDREPPRIIKIVPPTREILDRNDLICREFTHTQGQSLGIGSVDLGTVIQSVIVDLGAECQVFSVKLTYDKLNLQEHTVVFQTSNDMVTFNNLNDLTKPLMGRYVRILSNNDTEHEYTGIDVCRLKIK